MSGTNDKPVGAARASLLEVVRTRYFPELWYLGESWFQLAKTRSVLVVGLAIEELPLAFAKTGWDVTGIDPSPMIVDRVKKRFEESGLKGALSVAEPDLLPFANHAFPQLVSVNTLELAQSPLKAAHELGRLLAPGGRGVIASFRSLSPWGLAAVVRGVRGDGDPRPVNLLSKGALTKALVDARLRVDDVKDRAAYLPGGGGLAKLKLPVAGAAVALVEKPS